MLMGVFINVPKPSVVMTQLHELGLAEICDVRLLKLKVTFEPLPKSKTLLDPFKLSLRLMRGGFNMFS